MMEALDSKETGRIHGAEDVTAVGHRVVHGGDKFSAPLVITDEVIGESKRSRRSRRCIIP